jgi:dephospho-CoA kinase
MPAQPTSAPRTFTVGLTGGIGCGKTTVARGFSAHGIAVIDADEISHALTAPHGKALRSIAETFGSTLLQADGAMDRAAMRQLVFADASARSRLEAILHPMIREECKAQLARASSPYALLVVPLLIESNAYRAYCDRILVVDCPPEIQIQRVMARNGLSETEVRRIMATQSSREARLNAADDVIDNASAASLLQTRIDALHTQYLLESAQPFGKP